MGIESCSLWATTSAKARTALGTTINIVTVVDGAAHIWSCRDGKRIGPDFPAHTLISLIVPYLIYSQRTLLQSRVDIHGALEG